MSDYTLSVVQLCPDAHRANANAIAEAAGYGDNNLSVELRHTDGSTWWGCHAPWMPSALERSTSLPPEAPAQWQAALAAVVTSPRDMGKNPPEGFTTQHWLEALAANGLSLVQSDE